jgi:hypothetical protein
MALEVLVRLNTLPLAGESTPVAAGGGGEGYDAVKD